jgi:beta-N-acetylhexosaminidase
MDPEVRRLALSCLLLGYVGDKPPAWVLHGLADGLGGLVLFGSNVGDGQHVERLTGRLRRAAGRDIVLALDEEGGDVTRLDTVRGSAIPGAAALGYLDDPGATQSAYAAIGARLAEAGITVDLAPVADVNSDPSNPVIGVRSFGADPDRVARHVVAAVRGIQQCGVAACVKHFPGHGATTADSHHEAAVVPHGRAELAALDLPPFAAAVAAGTRAVMTGHLSVPALDPHSLATVSAAVGNGLLREELGFAGTVLTDALEMRAISATRGLAAAFVQALAAGADTVETGAQEYPGLLEELPWVVQCAIDDGRLTLDRLADASRRTAALAAPGAARAASPVAGAMTDDSGLGIGLAARCLEVHGRLPRLVRPLVAECRPPGGMASGELPWSLAGPLAARIGDVDAVAVTGASDVASLLDRAAGRSLVLVVRDPHRHPWQCRALEAAAAHHAAVIVDVGWPDPLPPELPLIRTRGVAPGLLAAAADRLAGA